MVEAPKESKVSSSMNHKRKKTRKIKGNLKSKESNHFLRSELNEVTASGVESADAESSESNEKDGNWISSQRFWRAGFCQICKQEGHEPIDCPRLHERLDRKKSGDIDKNIKVIKDDKPPTTQKESNEMRENKNKNEKVNDGVKSKDEDKDLKDKKK